LLSGAEGPDMDKLLGNLVSKDYFESFIDRLEKVEKGHLEIDGKVTN
jgi:hypothetical protein